MATIAAVRSILRSTSAVRTAATRFATASKPKSNTFCLPNRNSLSSPRIFRSPVELSSCVESLMPYHTATASALLTSMLSVTPRHFGWSLGGVRLRTSDHPLPRNVREPLWHCGNDRTR